MGVVCDVIFSLIAGLPEVYPNFFSVSDGVLQQYEKKFFGFPMHTGTPSGPGLTWASALISYYQLLELRPSTVLRLSTMPT